MLRNFLTVGGWTLVSRVLGLVRDQLLAALLGAGIAQDAFQIAFRLPNMFRRLFGEGAFNAAFVPLFTEKMTLHGASAARRFASNTMSWLAIWLAGITILGEIFMPWVISFIAPGFGAGSTRFDLAVTLSRITFPYLLLICIAALLAGVLNGMHRFALAAGAYVSFNIVGIMAIILGAHVFHMPAQAASWGITLSGIVQLGLLYVAARRADMKLHLQRPVMDGDMRNVLRRLAPGLVGSGVTQLNLTIDTMIATLLPAGSISWLYFADRINQLPLGVLGAAAGTTILPVLTRHHAAGDREGSRETLNRAIDYAMLLTLPASFGIIALAPEIMSALFGYGRFTVQDASFAAQSLRAYAIGLPAFVLVKVLSPAFFAQGDTKTPVRIGFGILALNLALNLSLYRPLAHIGPPLASSLAAMVNFGLLCWLLHRRGAMRVATVTMRRLSIMLGSAVIMAVLIRVAALYFIPDFMFWRGWARIGALGVMITSGAALYLACLQISGVARVRDLVAARRRMRNPTP
ncbi:putative lipid II flippase MurJ [Acetobacteraceae bacterium EV16G]|uniref:Probable lipid II flippase MurJ n=1 Tax=Sorlinia euscelidii TaxID=3081148 RepID=A0ABU7U2V8_9PROT